MVLLQVRPDEAGGWRLLVGRPDGAARAGRVTGATVQALTDQCTRALAPRPGLALPGRDAAQSLAERAVGGALWSAVREAGLDAVLARLLADAPPCVLFVEAEVGADLPWELLADESGEGLEETDRAVIVRRRTGPAPHPDPGAVGLRVIEGEPEATTAELAAGLRQLAPPGTALLHVVVHGHRVREGILALGQAAAAPGTLTHSLGPALRRAGLVVLHVCDAGGPGLERPLVDAVLAAGGCAVVAPRGSCSVRALLVFGQGLQAALDRGEPLHRAMWAGRAAVRGLGSPRPDARWHRLGLHVAADRRVHWTLPTRIQSSLAGLAVHLTRLGAAATVLTQAATAADQGYLGLDHIARLLPPASLGPTAHLALRSAPVHRHPDRPPSLSPRLSLVLAQLPEGAGAPGLTAAVLRGLQTWLGAGPQGMAPGGTTLELDPSGVSGRPAALLEVVGGPEDGRRLRLQRGESVGRFAPEHGAEHMLFAETGAWDPYVSRRHLRWLGEGWVELLRPARTSTGRVLRGTVPLQVGQVLWLSPSTGVRGESDQEDRPASPPLSPPEEA